MLDTNDIEDAVSDNSCEVPSLNHHYAPAGPLCRFIDIFWYWRKAGLLQGLECVLPTGTVELVIDLDSCRSVDSFICGMKSKPANITDSIQGNTTSRILGIHFRPGGVFPFLPFPLQELHNCDITLAELWGEQKANQLLSLIHESKTVYGKFKLLEQWLFRHMFHPMSHQPAVNMAVRELQTHTGIPIKSLAAKVNLSQKQFIQVFQNEMGLTPKLYARIMRFQKVLDTIDTNNALDWTEIAMACGYFDQSHYIHEFREFSGITPTNYLAIRTEHRNHIPLIN